MSEFLDKMSELSDVWQKDAEAYEAQNDTWWNGLTEKEREDAFYAVVKRIYKAEIVDQGSFRYALYDVFGFGGHMYMQGMECGYMELHNSIYTRREIQELRDRELASKGIKVETVTRELSDE